MPTSGPITTSERIESIDVLRGFALLGILVMNIQLFAMVTAAYSNPTAYGDLTGANWWVWTLSHVFADQKFMTLFSALFGAGIVIMWQRAEATGRNATSLHYRRTFWLMVFGLGHAYLMWSGDILFLYSLCALWVYWLRKLTARKLAIVGTLILLIPPALFVTAGLTFDSWPSEQVPTLLATWQPDAAAVAEEVANFQGGWSQQMQSRVPHTIEFQTLLLPIWGLWRAGGLMLLGMALFKVGFFSASLAEGIYRRTLIAGLAVGVPIVVLGVRSNFAADWDQGHYFLAFNFNYFGSLFVSAAYASAIMLLCKHGSLGMLQRGFAAVGRMALTNYLGHTIVCTTIFYGHGLGYFGEVDRVGQILTVLGVWAVQIPLSVWWLKHFRFGPFEWLWRSVSYMKLQPIGALVPRVAPLGGQTS